MKQITAGMTGTQYLSAINNLRKEYNVKDYGAMGDGVTDDTISIQTTINIVDSAGGGVVYFPNGVYIVGGALQTNIGGINYNSQLYIPFKAYNNTTKCNITLRGETPVNFLQSGALSIYVPPNTGVVIRSTLVTGVADAYIIASKGTADAVLTYNYNDLEISDIQFQVTPDGSSRITLGGIDVQQTGNAIIRGVTIFPFNLSLINSATPINNCVGIAIGKVNCYHTQAIENCAVGGFDTGFLIGEHTTLNNTYSICCVNGYAYTANYHISLGVRVGTHWCINSIKILASCNLKIVEFIDEYKSDGKWYDNAYTILDASNLGKGEIHYNIVTANTGTINEHFTKSGALKLQCIPIALQTTAEFTITGSKGGNAALADLITKLCAKFGFVDGTS